MRRLSPIRWITTACVVLSASLVAQPPQPRPPAPQSPSTLPVTPPTTPEPPAIPLTPSQRPPTHAQVTYAEGNISISADNASLNQILRQIASDTGIKITGGVVDERVFGQYGPAEPAQILATLLDGTGSNMVLVHRDENSPPELILTPRQGGPTPPNPNAAAFDDMTEKPEQPEAQEAPASQPSRFPPVPNGPPVTPPNSTEANPANSSQPESPNGVKTPQQIYEQLQRMRQQQQTPAQTQPQTTPQQ